MKRFFIGIIITLAAVVLPQKSLAVDPLTAIAGADEASEIFGQAGSALQTGVVGTTEGVAQILTDALGVLYLPLGLVESTLGAPFGGFGPGMSHIGKGLKAPFDTLFSTLNLPAKMVGG